MKAPNARATATAIVEKWLQQGAYPGRLLENVTCHRAFITELVYGVVRWRRALEWTVAELAHRPPDAALLPLLMTGLYQILMMDEKADYAIVNETVSLAKTRHSDPESGFINALLRRAVRERESFLRRLSRQPPGIRFSHPDILLERWTKAYGAAAALRLCAWNNQRAEVTVSANRLRITANRLQDMLSAKNLLARAAGPAGAEYFAVKRGISVQSLPGYAGGDFFVVDPAAGIAVELLEAQPGQRILDACAAPGGKTALLAAKLGRQGELHAWDVHPDRLERLRGNLRRLQMHDWVSIRQVNLLHPPQAGLFDRVLLDAPCSNTGVIRHKPDVRWRFNTTRLTQLAGLQAGLLSAAARMLRPGGRMVYSTCSLEPEENRRMVATWIERNPDFVMAGEAATFPPDAGMDGMYAGAIVRKK